MKNIEMNLHDDWIHVKGLGKIGMYSKYDGAILLDYSMKWIIGTNERIICKEYEVFDKIKELFE